MTVISPPSYLQYGAHSASSDRLTSAAFLQPGATPLSTRGGVRPSGDGNSLRVTAQATATNSVQVAAGSVFIPESDSQGVYVVHNDAPVTLTIGNASTTQNRRDLVIMEVLDQEVSGSSNLAQLRVVAGTSVSGTATAPAVPGNAIALAEVSVPAGSTTVITTALITDRRVTAIAIGGTLPATSTTLPSNPYHGMEVYCSDDDTVRRWSTTANAWRVISIYPLPAPVTAYASVTTQNITSTTFANLPTRHFIDFTAAKSMYVLLHVGCWLNSPTATDGRVTVALTGATTGPGPAGAVLNTTTANYGDTIFNGTGTYSSGSVTIPWLLSPGTTRVEIVGMRSNTSALPLLAYPVLRVTPLRYA